MKSLKLLIGQDLTSFPDKIVLDILIFLDYPSIFLNGIYFRQNLVILES